MAEKSLFAGGKPVHSSALISEYLSNGSTINGVGNYASVERFKITCAQGLRKLHINRLIVSIEDVGNFDSAKYGNNITLTNGINVCTRDSGDVLLKNLTSTNVKTNAGWAAVCHDVTLHDFGIGNQILTVRWTFGRMGKPVTLSPTEYLTVELQDDFTGLVNHNFLVQGYYA